MTMMIMIITMMKMKVTKIAMIWSFSAKKVKVTKLTMDNETL